MMSRAGVLAIFIAALVGCSGKVAPDNSGGDSGATPSGRSGVPASRAIGSLTTEQQAALCDWTAATFGGYGKTVSCGSDYGTSGPESREDCMRGLPGASCTMTVAQFEACVGAFARVDWCTVSIDSLPECSPLRACASTDPGSPDEEPPPVVDAG